MAEVKSMSAYPSAPPAPAGGSYPGAGSSHQEAPPTYEETMAQDTRATLQVAALPGAPQVAMPSAPVVPQLHYVPNVPLLTFVDFLPRCLTPGSRGLKTAPSFEDFRSILPYVNSWFQSKPGCRISSVEEIDRSVNYEGVYEIDNAITLTKASEVNFVIRGLRIWVRPRYETDADPPERLDYFNYLPKRDLAGDGSFLSLDNTLQMLNSQLAERPLPGRMVSIRTIQLPLGKIDQLSHVEVNDMRADQAIINNSVNGNTFFNFIRVYYSHGDKSTQRTDVGMVDFLPEVTSRGNGHSEAPKTEPFSVLTQRAATWVHGRHGKDIHVVNFQTVTHIMNLTSNMRNCSINSRQTCLRPTFLGNDYKRLNVKFLRVSYTWPLSESSPRLELFLSTRTVSPVLIKLRTAETIGQTVNRLNKWLKEAGAAIYGVETLDEPYHEYTGRTELVESSFITTKKGRYTIKAIRLYINGLYADIDMMNAMMNTGEKGGGASGSKTCAIL